MNITQILLASISISSDGIGAGVAYIAFPTLAAVSFYIIMYRYYRNTDKSYNFEKETLVELRNMKNTDVKIGENNGTKNRWVNERNSNQHRNRVRRVQVTPQNTQPTVEQVLTEQQIPKPPLQNNQPEIIPGYIPPQN